MNQKAMSKADDVFADEEEVASLTALVRAFAEAAPRRVAEWRARLEGHAAAGERVVLWGAGSKAVALLTAAGPPEAVVAVVDINPFKQGTFLPGTGHPIVAPADLASLRPDRVLVMNAVYADEIRADLARLGLRPAIDALP